MGLNLLEKTELWVNEITLDGTNLTDLANAVAHAMGMQDGEVLVSAPATLPLTFWLETFHRRISWARKPPFWTPSGLFLV